MSLTAIGYSSAETDLHDPQNVTHWTNLSNIRAADGATATYQTWMSDPDSATAECSGLGFDSKLPADAVITGVFLEFNANGDASNAGRIASLGMAYVLGGVVGSYHTIPGSNTSAADYSVDVTGDRAWTRDDLLDANFKFRIKIARAAGGSSQATGAFDYARVRVTYTAAPTFVNAATTNEASGSTTHPITVPAGVQVGDLLLLACDSGTTIGVTHTGPAGWTPIDTNHDMGSASNPSASLWCKIATASEVAGQVVTITTGASSTAMSVAIAAWRNVDPASLPLGWAVTNTGTTQVTNWTVDASAISITKTKTLVVFISAEDTNAGVSHNTTPPSGFTEVVDTLPGVAKGFEIAWRTIDATNLGVLSASVSPAGRSINWVVAFNGADGVIPPAPTAGQLWPHGKKGTSLTIGQLFPRRIVP